MYTPVEGMGRLAVELAKGRWGDETLFRNVRMRELIKTLGDAGASQPARSGESVSAAVVVLSCPCSSEPQNCRNFSGLIYFRHQNLCLIIIGVVIYPLRGTFVLID